MAFKLSPPPFGDVYQWVWLHALLHQASLGHLIGQLSLCVYTSTGGESIYWPKCVLLRSADGDMHPFISFILDVLVNLFCHRPKKTKLTCPKNVQSCTHQSANLFLFCYQLFCLVTHLCCSVCGSETRTVNCVVCKEHLYHFGSDWNERRKKKAGIIQLHCLGVLV